MYGYAGHRGLARRTFTVQIHQASAFQYVHLLCSPHQLQFNLDLLEKNLLMKWDHGTVLTVYAALVLWEFCNSSTVLALRE